MSAGHSIRNGTDARRLGQLGLLVIAIAFGAGGAWAAVAPLAGAVIASGVVQVVDRRKTVQHLEGGIVESIEVREGELVETGQPLLVLGDEQGRARLDALERQLDAVSAKVARLQAERDRLPQLTFPVRLERRATDPKVEAVLRTEVTLFRANRRALERRLELLLRQGEEIAREIESIESEQDAAASAAALLDRELSAYAALRASRAVAEMHVLVLERRVEDYRGRRAHLSATLAKARQRAAELELRAVTLQSQFRQRAADELAAANARLFDLEERLRPARDAVDRQTVTAPIAGRVIGLAVFTVGGVIRPGERLLDIVPQDVPLLIEARIDVDDIEAVQPGMTADVRLTAYEQRTTPVLEGELVYVSAGELEDPQTGSTHYLAHVRVQPESLAATGDLRLRPGMRAEVFLETAERTALDYLLAPVTASLRKAMREP